MRIVRAQITECVLPKDDPTWRFALAARPDVEGMVVQLEADSGEIGYGFASGTALNGYPFVASKAIAYLMAEKLIGANPEERRPLVATLEHEARGCHWVKAGFEVALWDLLAKSSGEPIYRLLGGSFRKSIPMLRILALKDPDKVAENALKRVQEGYRYLKIKLDNEDPALDAARVAAVREAVGPGINLTLDANQSYSVKGAIDIYERVARYGIDLFEQPVRKDDFEGLRAVKQAVGCVVEADESARDLEDIHRLLAMGAADSISVKVGKLGGIDALMEAAALCRAANVSCRVGIASGGRLVSAAAMHFVASTPNISYACELAEFERLLGDPFEGLPVVDGELTVPEDAGIGVRPREGAMV